MSVSNLEILRQNQPRIELDPVQYMQTNAHKVINDLGKNNKKMQVEGFCIFAHKN